MRAGVRRSGARGRDEDAAGGHPLIDLHFHCLPGIDDGPEDWEQAVALCRAAAAAGTTAIVATPHVLRGGWLNEDASARDQLVMKLNTLLGGKPAILPGCEFFWASDALELLERPDAPLTTLNRSRYLLVEFAPGAAPRAFDEVLHELALQGVIAVIAHPERNPFFVRDPERLEALVREGAVVQVTAGSLLGDFGKWARDASNEFFRRGLVHVVASDAHSVERRPPRLADARELVRKEWGLEAEEALFVANPEAIVSSRLLAWQPA